MEKASIVFGEQELEIAMVTYNRCEFVAEWLKCCYDQIKSRNIHLSIWDSSTNDDTEKFIHTFRVQKNDIDLEYHRLESTYTIGYKPMFPLLQSLSKYVWVVGDSRYHDFNLLDRKIFPYLKQNVDFALIYCGDREEYDGKWLTNREELLREGLYSMLCIGLSIYKTSVFEELKADAQLRVECDRKYKDNEGMAWLGYFLEMFALKDYTAVSSVVPIINIMSDKKVVGWYKKFYNILIGNLCEMMEALSHKYQCTEIAIKQLWKYWLPDGAAACYQARKGGDLNEETYRKYKENGMLDRCSLHGDRLRRFAFAVDEELDTILEQEMEAEKLEYKNHCLRNLEKIKIGSCGRDVWIYGAGVGGKVLAEFLREQGISFCGFLDQAADDILFCEGMPVKKVKDAELENAYILISLRGWGNFCVGELLEQGIDRNRIFYISLEGD